MKSYSILEANETKKITNYWLLLAVSAMAVAGLYSILLVLLRTPVLTNLIPYKQFFHSSLIVHVDLSILVWFFAFELALIGRYISNVIIQYVTLFLVAAGAVVIAISPLYPSIPLLNNYIPILQNFPFAFGLGLFGTGVLVGNVYMVLSGIAGQALRLFVALTKVRVFGVGGAIAGDPGSSPGRHDLSAEYIYAITSAIITIAAYVTCYLAYRDLNAVNYIAHNGAQDYFERLFWGGGHLLQFMYLQLLQYAWVKLSGTKASRVMALLNMLFVIPILFILPKAYTPEYLELFTKHMQYFAGIAPSILAGCFIFREVRGTLLPCEGRDQDNSRPDESQGLVRESRYLGRSRVEPGTTALEPGGTTLEPGGTALEPGTTVWRATACLSVYLSMLLFFVGGLISLFIVGSNTIIPAHYHGSVVGITIALQGLVCLHLNKFSRVIPIIYSVGQLMHIAGLAISGGYGALRKTPGEVLSTKAQIALGFMGAGGLIALIGGLLFVIICYNAFFKNMIKT